MLKSTRCPHCKSVGSLIRHGCLRGYDDQHPSRKTVRAQRVFCSNRHRAQGCGRTFNIWWADKVSRLFLTAESLWQFLKQTVATGNKMQAFRDIECDLSDSAPYLLRAELWSYFWAISGRIVVVVPLFYYSVNSANSCSPQPRPRF